jgi:hypothetical protein
MEYMSLFPSNCPQPASELHIVASQSTTTVYLETDYLVRSIGIVYSFQLRFQIVKPNNLKKAKNCYSMAFSYATRHLSDQKMRRQFAFDRAPLQWHLFSIEMVSLNYFPRTKRWGIHPDKHVGNTRFRSTLQFNDDWNIKRLDTPIPKHTRPIAVWLEWKSSFSKYIRLGILGILFFCFRKTKSRT